MENEERTAALRTACVEKIGKLSDPQVLRLLAAYELSVRKNSSINNTLSKQYDLAK